MKPAKPLPMIDPAHYGISFSAKQCRNFGLDTDETLEWLLGQGWRRFRLMSYWNETEPSPGEYNFTELDRQVAAISAAGGQVTLCLGIKQPRWPEYHWPAWVLTLTPPQRTAMTLKFIETVVRRYRDNPVIISWQLENEALLRDFGKNILIDRQRLKAEYNLARSLDNRPIIMSTSNGWGIPLRRPRPDIVGFSYYTIMHQKGNYHETVQKPWLHRLRRVLITFLLRRQAFIHELQLEPWGHTAIWKMTLAEQDRSMNVTRIRRNLQLAKTINAAPIDLWGAEWWYWRYKQGDSSIIDTINESLHIL